MRYVLEVVVGLSPRVRGNLTATPSETDGRRSIPARAGEPLVPFRTRRITPVYPRACGGTLLRRRPARSMRGLSPRVRGNQNQLGKELTEARSIPARAGEPEPAWQRTHRGPVYPRACGGTSHINHGTACAGGLSPRVRGNP